MPTPVSAQVKVKVTGPWAAGSAGGSSRQEKTMEPPARLYFTALLETFSSTWRRWRGLPISLSWTMSLVSRLRTTPRSPARTWTMDRTLSITSLREKGRSSSWMEPDSSLFISSTSLTRSSRKPEAERIFSRHSSCLASSPA